MKSNLYTITFLFALLISACQNRKETNEHHHEDASSNAAVQTDTVRKSIPKEEHAQIGKAHVTIKYHAPAVRGRTIWNGLVPYGEVWVTGAHSATTFEVDKTIVVAEKEIPAGKYAIFTIPGQEKWTLIINRNWDQHLADEYDEKEDVIRLTATPEQNEHIQERLKYSITADGETRGVVSIRWEKIKVAMPFQVK
jgi:hypothetical protein